MKNNIFTPLLLDVIIPSQRPNESNPAKLDKSHDELDFDQIFFVMEYVTSDFKKTMKNADQNTINEDHVKIMLYNCLCAMNYIH